MQHPKRRVLRRASRKPQSPYRVRLGQVSPDDSVILDIFDENDETKPVATYVFSGRAVMQKKSIYFTAVETAGRWAISFSGSVSPKSIVV